MEQYIVEAQITNGRIKQFFFNHKLEAEKEVQILQRLGFKNVRVFTTTNI